MKPIIEAKDLEKTYSDGTKALRGVSFNIKEGEFVAIMGPSGSGKSTLLHIIGSLDHATVGSLKFDGKNIKDFSEEELSRVRNEEMGFVFQMFNLLPKTTVLQNVKLPLVYSPVKESEWDEIAMRAIKAVELEHRADYFVSKISGGEKQRVAIARALVNNPKIIFADEPTGNLDSKSGQIIMEYLQNLNNQGHTIVLITHETYTAEHAERIISIKDGKIESDAKVENRRKASTDFLK